VAERFSENPQIPHSNGDGNIHHRRLTTMVVAALGIVFGDIGTSPLYAVRECFSPHFGLSLTPDNVLGVLSIIFWTMTLVISIKYMLFILEADNRGEGGILALMALATMTGRTSKLNARCTVF
jgi:KUP system potassium uptake protein